MTEMATPAGTAPGSWTRWAWFALPFLALAAALVWIVATDPMRGFNVGAPPVEALTFERTILDDAGMHFQVRAGGSEPMTIAQMQVDDAYWLFTQDPPGEIARGGTAWIHIPYPWVLGDAHMVIALTNTGTAFEHEIAVAIPTPKASPGQLIPQAIVGMIVGILPVAIGLMFYPALRGVGRGGMNFLLALTVGLLAFLLIDMSEDALELAAESAALFQGPAMVVLAAAASFLLLMAIGRWRGTPAGLALSFFIALGIGLHNLGEGLAIGAAFAAGSAGLGTFLVIGFAIHNITEGIGIAAPILKEKPPLWSFLALTLVAGLPAVIGLWLGSLATAPQWSSLALAIGAGAILQVIVEVSAYLMRSNDRKPAILLSPPVIAGLIAGTAFMYVTAAFVKI
jgi:zinc transporter, ZIP family